MKAHICFLFLIFSALGLYGQEVVNDTVKGTLNDTIVFNVEMEEVVITNVKDSISAEERKNLSLLKRRAIKVYPYAKTAADKITMLNNTLDKLKTDKEKKKYSKIVEKYLNDEFEGRLKKLSKKEGQILVKLIHRQTGESTFDLIKEHKSGWKAFWSNRVAHMFNIDLKKKYSPATVPEDFYIEGFLLQAFKEHRLQVQNPAFAIDYPAIKRQWRAKKNDE